MYVLVGTCWIAGTVYLDPDADFSGTRPLDDLGLAGDFLTCKQCRDMQR